MHLEFEPASEPLHISEKQLFSNRKLVASWGDHSSEMRAHVRSPEVSLWSVDRGSVQLTEVPLLFWDAPTSMFASMGSAFPERQSRSKRNRGDLPVWKKVSGVPGNLTCQRPVCPSTHVRTSTPAFTPYNNKKLNCIQTCPFYTYKYPNSQTYWTCQLQISRHAGPHDIYKYKYT